MKNVLLVAAWLAVLAAYTYIVWSAAAAMWADEYDRAAACWSMATLILLASYLALGTKR